jgi:hypothetical protein
MSLPYTIGKYSDSGNPIFIVGFKCRGTVQAYLCIDGDYYVSTDFHQAYRSNWKDVHRHLFQAQKMLKDFRPGDEAWQSGDAEIFEIKYVALDEVAEAHARDKAVNTIRDKLEQWELSALREHLRNGGEL